MSNNDFVAMGQHICPVCHQQHDSGEILIHTRLRPIDLEKRVTGYGMCKEHQALKDAGMVALIEADPKKGTREEPYLTGRIIHVSMDAYQNIFSDKPHSSMIAYIEIEGVEKLVELYKRDTGLDLLNPVKH